MKKSIFTKLLATIAAGVMGLNAWAATPEVGKVYRVVNEAYGAVMATRGPNDVLCCVTQKNDNNQLWLVVDNGEAGTISLRSLGTSQYVRSSNAQSQAWGGSNACSNQATHLVIEEDGNNYAIRAINGTNQYDYMHCDGQRNIVGWEKGMSASRWSFTEVSKTQAEIDQALEAGKQWMGEAVNAPKYQTLLNAIFADKACTELNSTYAGKSVDAIKADANYKALPKTLQDMVIKVKTGDWSETDPFVKTKEGTEETYQDKWDSAHAKKYRVQMYEPYADAAAASGLNAIQPYTNQNNPTGIVSDEGTVLYVMVDKLPAAGATLFINGTTGTGMWNNCTQGVELEEGLNIISCTANEAHHFVYYTVAATKTVNGKPRPNHKVTDYEPIKIHIEGGSVNGFFDYRGDNLYTPDTHEDFVYTSERARFPMYDLVGEFVILHFHLFDEYQKPGESSTKDWGLKKVLDKNNYIDSVGNPLNNGYKEYVEKGVFDLVKIMTAWDRMCFAERALMGLQPDKDIDHNTGRAFDHYESVYNDPICGLDFHYADYFNNRMMGITMQGSLYMNATSWRTAYAIYTMPPILLNLPWNSGAIWGPAHEYGHMNQQPIKLAGSTEISNNLFSLVAVYYQGNATSRADSMAEQLRDFNAKKSFHHYTSWGATRMFYQLWCYYHAAGFNRKFYPRLYELLRRDPLQHPGTMNDRYDQLHFYKMACIAAQEDLTDYFDAWGFFVPTTNLHIGDYANYYVTLTDADIEAVKAEVKALKLPKNDRLLLLDDRVRSRRLDDPTKERDSYNGFPIAKCGIYGGIWDFREGRSAKGNMSFDIDGFNVTINLEEGADPGVGFLVYNNDGKLLGFINDLKMTLSSEAIAQLMGGTAKVYAVGSNPKEPMVEVTNNFLNAPADVRRVELKKLMDSVQPTLGLIDQDEETAGLYRPYYAKGFVDSFATAEAVYNNADASAELIADTYIALVNAHTSLQADEAATVPFIPGATYQIRSVNVKGRALSASTKNVTNAAAKTPAPDTQQWTFETVDAANAKYRLKNVKQNLYMGMPDDKGDKFPMVAKSKAATFTVAAGNGTGQFNLVCDNNWNMCINISGGKSDGAIVAWSSDNNTQYYLRLVYATERGDMQNRLGELVRLSSELLDESGDITVDRQNIALTADMLYSNAPYTGTQYPNDTFTSYDVLVDGDIQTYFHSDYSGANSEDGRHHNITVDLGEGNSTNSFQIDYILRTIEGNSPVQAPQTIILQGSNVGGKDNKNWTNIRTISEGLPTASGATYSSPVISNGNDYRYIRMQVSKAQASAGGHAYFALAEWSINHAKEIVTPGVQYPNVTAELMLAVRDALETARPLVDSNPTFAKASAAYEVLYPAYVALANAMGAEMPPIKEYSGIEEITLDGGNASSTGIYDLQGRKLDKVGAKGLYIIDGQKVVTGK